MLGVGLGRGEEEGEVPPGWLDQLVFPSQIIRPFSFKFS